jgi:hypothetical protein
MECLTRFDMSVASRKCLKMSEEALSEEIQEFLLRHIGSVAHLEALLFFRAHPAETLDARSLARRLYVRESEMVAALAELAGDGFLVLENGLCRYAPPGDDQARIDAVADAYTHQLIAITKLIHDNRRNIEARSDGRYREF